MTEDLQSLLRDRAAAAELAPPDVAAIAALGSRRLRRRRGLAVVGAVATVAVVAGGVALLPRGHDVAQPAHETAPGVSWAKGSTIHDGDRTIDTGHRISAYVRTRVGYVFTDSHGVVWSEVDGSVTRVGQTLPFIESDQLVADGDGTLAGWVDPSGKTLTYVVLDQATGDIVSTTGRASSKPLIRTLQGSIIAMDDDTAYWRDGDQTVERSVEPGGGSVLWSSSTKPEEALLAVAAGVAVQRNQQTGDVAIGPVDGAAAVRLPAADFQVALLSPDGHWVDTSVDDLDIRDTATGKRVTWDTGYHKAYGYEWLDDDTLAVLAARTMDSNYQLLTCSVSRTSCTVVVPDLGEGPTTGGNGLGFQLPIGGYFYPFPHG